MLTKKQQAKLNYLNEKFKHFEHPLKEMLVCLFMAMGNVTEATKNANVSRGTFYYNYNNNAAFKEAVDEVEESNIDFAETMLKKSIASGSDTATIFFLKTKGKKRGYIERQEYTGKDGQPLSVKHEIVHIHSNIPIAQSEEDVEQ